MLHTHEVTGSSPVVSTKTLESHWFSRVFLFVLTVIGRNGKINTMQDVCDFEKEVSHGLHDFLSHCTG